jgi:hypothetical protein
LQNGEGVFAEDGFIARRWYWFVDAHKSPK